MGGTNHLRLWEKALKASYNLQFCLIFLQDFKAIGTCRLTKKHLNEIAKSLEALNREALSTRFAKWVTTIKKENGHINYDLIKDRFEAIYSTINGIQKDVELVLISAKRIAEGNYYG